MKLIILDHFRRWWWVWVIGGIFYGILMVGAANPNDHRLELDAFFPVGVFLGSVLLAVDVLRGHSRALLALPVPPVRIARAWWWLAVGIPAALLAVISCAALGVAFLIYSKPPVIFSVAINWLDNFLLLGVTFFALTNIPTRGYDIGDWKQQVRGVIFGVMWGGSIGGWMFFKRLNILTPLGTGIFLLAVILTVLGWYRAETLVMERAGLRPGSPPPSRKDAAPSRCAEGIGGVMFLAQTLFTRMIVIGFSMLTAVFVILAFMIRGAHSQFSHDFLGGSMVSLFTFQFLWIMSVQFFLFALHIRHLRVMPMATATLARVLVFVPLAAIVVVFCASVLLRTVIFQLPLPGLEELIRQGCLLQISSAIIPVPLLVWRGLDLVNYGIGMVILIGGALATVFFTGPIPMAVDLTAAPLIVAGVYVVTKMLLERNSHPYRPRVFQFGAWNWGTGR